jgi:hypothetical protein
MIALFFFVLGLTLYIGRTEFADMLATGLSRLSRLSQFRK